MRHGDRLVVLVADYELTEPKTIELRLLVRVASGVTDLGTGENPGTASAGQPVPRLTLTPARGRLLLVKPRE